MNGNLDDPKKKNMTPNIQTFNTQYKPNESYTLQMEYWVAVQYIAMPIHTEELQLTHVTCYYRV